LRAIPTRFRGMNFCTSSACFAPSLVRQPNSPEWTQIVRNATKRQSMGQWGGSGAFVCLKFRCDFVARSFALVQAVLHQVSKCNQTVPNAPKSYETYQNVSFGSKGVDRVRSLRKIPSRLRGTNFCTSSANFGPSFVRQPNGPERTQIVRNAPIHQFRV
jgi:hypothetical protein